MGPSVLRPLRNHEYRTYLGKGYMPANPKSPPLDSGSEAGMTAYKCLVVGV